MADRCVVIPFPLVKRIGKVRDVAKKLMDKSTDRHAVSYRQQVAEGLYNQLGKIGVSEEERVRQIRAFMLAVRVEANRRLCLRNHPGGRSA
ncbi:DUF6074 family protein [Phyllobacterium lublinensis]|uniref:DUF6074 family protein n=1 Tax=Phyllobacterium lublinensis TaxID=2875708 RepID=UPI001CCAB563|nr:DUF6074 family protein [Phyllobacterium sp. 2063]MBZ9655042.1 DUF6074 family protein [Phyllobacterium sp. 2063]